MRIIFLADHYPPAYLGGGEVSTNVLVQALKQSGHEMLVISTTQNKDQDLQYKICDGIDVFFIYSSFNSKLRNLYCLYNLKILKILNNKFREYQPDVVHAQIISSHISFYSLVLARRYTKAVFFTARDTMPFTYGKYWWYIDQKDFSTKREYNYRVKAIDLLKQARKAYLPGRNLLIRHWINNNCYKIIAVSEEIKKAYLNNGFKNIEVIYNSVDTAEYDQVTQEEIAFFKKEKNLTGKKIIFIAGRLSALKGLNVILKSLAIIKKNLPEVVLAIAAHHDVGDVDDDLRKNIKYLGWLDQKQMKIAFRACDLSIIPSIYLDSLPRTIFEAMAAKKPVVATCFGGAKEAVVDGQTGYVVNPFDFEKMAEKMIEILSDEKRACQFGEAGYARVKEKFNVKTQVEKILALYRQYNK